MILTKDGVQKEFTPRAAKIAIAHLGWSEEIPLSRPSEIGTRTRPTPIGKPIELIKPAIYPGDKVKEKEFTQTFPIPTFPGKKLVNPDVNLNGSIEKVIEVKVSDITPMLVKKTRKPPVRSKSTKK